MDDYELEQTLQPCLIHKAIEGQRFYAENWATRFMKLRHLNAIKYMRQGRSVKWITDHCKISTADYYSLVRYL